MYLYLSLWECKSFFVVTINLFKENPGRLGGATVEVCVEINLKSFFAEAPECELQCRHQTTFYYYNATRY